MHSGSEIPENRFQNLNLSRVPLKGSNLIEASAGTGKTYTIAGLFLRLVLQEPPLNVDEILVVTFTEAATGELKERIRRRLREAAEALSGSETDDLFLKELIASVPDRNTALRHLKDAIRDFDESAIFTIHAFCLRMLQEHSFESGSLFDTELMTDPGTMKQEIAEDFWRRHFYTASSLFVKFALEKEKISPQSLFSLLENRISQPDIRIIPQTKAPNLAEYETAFLSAFSEAREQWQKSRADVENILFLDKGLSRKVYDYKRDNVLKWVENMDDCLRNANPDPLLFKDVDKFTNRELTKRTKKKYDVPSHPFFDRCEKLLHAQTEMIQSFEKYLLHLKTQLFAYARQEMKQRMESRNLRSFDDLLTDLRNALRAERGEELAARIRGKYKAALIDEFQDTDPVQYEIFKTIFQRDDRILFLIGDPKQAIYSFRGADIFAYMEAQENIDSQFRYTLGENWRSEPDLIKAVNTLFQKRNTAFVYEEIAFSSANAADKKEREILTFSGKSEPPLQIWVVPGKEEAEGKDGLVSQEMAGEMIVRAVSAEISRLIRMGQEETALMGDRKLAAGDIAVLVRKKKEAELVQKALSGLGIPSVLHSTGDIFDTHEALEIERLLNALIQPRNEILIRTALATDMMGQTGEELDRLKEDETGWEKWLVKFGEYSRIWNTRGFIRMFRQFLAQEEVLPRLMALADGERRCTNVLHLCELLHQADMKKKSGMIGVVKWLSEQRHQKDQRPDENPLRLESDENAVKLVTIHKSKGLEYPVVFCPFAWHESERRNADKNPIVFHDESAGRTVTCDLGSADVNEHRCMEVKENLAENLRLLYVALTRARNRCYLVWGRISSAGTSAPAWLFHGHYSDGDMLEAAKQAFHNLTNATMMNAMEELERISEGTIKVSSLPTEPGVKCSLHAEEGEMLAPLRFDGKIAENFRVSSFSSLVTEKHHGTEITDYDAQVRESEPVSGPVSEDEAVEHRDIFSFPRGTVPGTCLHAIFEELDFTLTDQEDIRKAVLEKLERYAMESEWAETITQMISHVLSTPLEADSADFTLSRISFSERMNELEFYFPMKTVSPERLRSVFETGGTPDILGTSGDFPRQIGNLKFSRTEGFMKGFIDLVFRFKNRYYLLDWKSNHLGNTVEDYHRDFLGRAMREEIYVLQYHLYTLALHRYLRMRIPDYDYEKHFGGVFYIFLRGVDRKAGPNFGIFRDRPRREMIQDMEKVICI